MWVFGFLILVVVLLALTAWWRSYRARTGTRAPELHHEASGPPPERDETWDPRARYDADR